MSPAKLLSVIGLNHNYKDMPWISRIFHLLFFLYVILCWKILYLNSTKRTIIPDQVLHESSLVILHDSPLIRNGVFWSELAESYVPKGVLFNEASHLIRQYRGQVAKSVTQPSIASNRRQLNAFVTLEDGTRFYAKNRKQTEAWDEVLCFYLSHLLQMDNVPLVFLTKLNTVFWNHVNISSLKWKANDTVSLVRLIDDVRENTEIPHLIYKANVNGVTVTGSLIKQSKSFNNNSKYVAEVIQFGSLIVFDFLVMQKDRYLQWATNVGEFPFVTSERTLNLAKSPNGKLWIIDNEYSIFGVYFTTSFTKLNQAYDKLLKSMCVFQSTLVESLEILSKQRSFSDTIFNFSSANEPLLREMDKYKYMLCARILMGRVLTVIRWIRHCQALSILNKP